MSKVVVLCRVDNCYFNNDYGNDRKDFIPTFLNQLSNLAGLLDADEVLFSFFTDNLKFDDVSYCELSIFIDNLIPYEDRILHFGDIFSKDKHLQVYCMKNLEKKSNNEVNYIERVKLEDSSNNIDKDMLEYIKRISENSKIKRIIFIDKKEHKFLDNNCDVIIAKGLKNIINELNNYIIDNSKAKELTYINNE